MGRPAISMVLLAVVLGQAPSLAGGVLRASKAHHQNFFVTLMKDYKAAPKDKGGFITKCTEIVTDLLPDLREEYTERQVPHVLAHSCEEFRTKVDFVQNHTLDNGTALTRSRTQCKYFAKLLAKDYSKRRGFDGWCGKMWGFLEEQELSPAEARRRLKDVQNVRDQLDVLKADQLRAMTHIGRAKFKRFLAPWAPHNGSNGTYEENFTNMTTEDVSEGEEESAAKEWLNCCPMDCKVCQGFQVVGGVVRVHLQANGTVTRTRRVVTKKAAATSDEEDDDEEDNDESDESDADTGEQDTEEDPEEDTEDEDTEEECEDDDPDCTTDNSDDEDYDDEEFLQKQKRSFRRKKGKVLKALAKLRRHSKGKKGKDIYHMLVREFEQIELFPKQMKTKPFIDKCTGIITDLMPQLQEEYTWTQVPNILLHECDVYTSKEDFRTKLMRLEHAKQNCVFFAERLGDKFRKGQDYKEWCSNVYAQLLRSSNNTNMTERQKKLLEKRPDLSRKVYRRQMSAECCPPNCRYCE